MICLIPRLFTSSSSFKPTSSSSFEPSFEMIPEVAAGILKIQSDQHEDGNRGWRTEKGKARVFYGICNDKDIHQLDMRQ